MLASRLHLQSFASLLTGRHRETPWAAVGRSKGPEWGSCREGQPVLYIMLMFVVVPQPATMLHSLRILMAEMVMMQSATGNAAKAGLKNGDTVIYTSSFFGDELWPSDGLGLTRSALANAPSPVTVIYVSVNCLVSRFVSCAQFVTSAMPAFKTACEAQDMLDALDCHLIYDIQD